MKTPSSHLRQTQALGSASSLQARSTDQGEGGPPSLITVFLNGTKAAFGGSNAVLPLLVPSLSIDQDRLADFNCLPFTSLMFAVAIAKMLDPTGARPPLRIVTTNRPLIEVMRSNEGANRTTDWRDADGNREKPQHLLSRLDEWAEITWLHWDDYLAINHGPTLEVPPDSTLNIGIDGFAGLFSVSMPHFNIYYVSTATGADDEPETRERSLLLGCGKGLKLAKAVDLACASTIQFFSTDDAMVERMSIREPSAASGLDGDIIQPISDDEQQWPSVTYQLVGNHFKMKAALAAFGVHLRDALPY